VVVTVVVVRDAAPDSVDSGSTARAELLLLVDPIVGHHWTLL
jgi:hypothetical protein